MKFTDKAVQALKPKAARYTVTETGVSSDMRGLQLRVYPSGGKVFRLRYRMDGRVRLVTLGTWPVTTIAEAHQKVQEHRKELREGKDPAAWREDAKQANESAPTVQAIYEDFRDTHIRKKLKQPDYAEGIIEKHVLVKWKHRKAASLTRREIIQHFRKIADDTPRVAHVARTLTAQMLAHAVNEGLLDASPAVGLPTIGSVGEKREVKLTDDQIREFWQALDNCNMVPQIRAALRFLLVTGQRRQEIALARWEHIDREAKTWRIPPEASKNGREHIVPLSGMALALLDEFKAAGTRKHEDGTVTESAYLVPSRTTEDKPVDPHAITSAIANNAKVIKIPGLTPHALRHTVATQLSALGVERLHVTKVLNHSDRGITARYDSHDYMQEKRDALELWAKHLQDILDGKASKVVPIGKEKRRAAR